MRCNILVLIQFREIYHFGYFTLFSLIQITNRNNCKLFKFLGTVLNAYPIV